MRCPAETTSPARASRYCTRPLLGETSTRSTRIDWSRSTSASAALIADSGLIALGIGRNICGLGGFEPVAPLIQELLR